MLLDQKTRAEIERVAAERKTRISAITFDGESNAWHAVFANDTDLTLPAVVVDELEPPPAVTLGEIKAAQHAGRFGNGAISPHSKTRRGGLR